MFNELKTYCMLIYTDYRVRYKRQCNGLTIQKFSTFILCNVWTRMNEGVAAQYVDGPSLAEL